MTHPERNAQRGPHKRRHFLPYDKSLTPLAREQRKSMTDDEKRLWWFFRALPVHVYRKKPLGAYVVDFYIPSKKTVIELDGSRPPGTPGKERDAQRDAFYNEFHLTEILIPVRYVRTQFDRVCNRLKERLELD